MIYDWFFLIHPNALMRSKVYPRVHAYCIGGADGVFGARISTSPEDAVVGNYRAVSTLVGLESAVTTLNKRDKLVSSGYQLLYKAKLDTCFGATNEDPDVNQGCYLNPQIIATFFQACAIQLNDKARKIKQVDPSAMLDAVVLNICDAKAPTTAQKHLKFLHGFEDEIFDAMKSYANTRPEKFNGWFDSTTSLLAQDPVDLKNLPSGKICPVW